MIDLENIKNWPDGATHWAMGDFMKWVDGKEYWLDESDGEWMEDNTSWSEGDYVTKEVPFLKRPAENVVDVSDTPISLGKLLVLSEWEKHIKDFDTKLNKFIDVTMIALESPHIEASFRVTEHYTEIVADSVDLPVDLLMDWWLGYKLGEVPMKVYIEGELSAEVSTLAELLNVWEKVK